MENDITRNRITRPLLNRAAADYFESKQKMKWIVFVLAASFVMICGAGYLTHNLLAGF